ncbi:shikimate 5-dehydrogenase [Bifidobacterium saguini DSM 23967]|uniref:Shikimate 5-dehydrogenase n=2 Tax=Bifidobacterium saguini TaxID=762210 RepID=A0A087D9M4_9BIFI|nr:shikimate dehydrogenase [Bifidobacterium saguini]KFI92224.1 shikimate 5-dehydrogenase [Bifidobacterium saguini DSM 23967]QTB90937.1 shikimate dehydrogenase [Bifidobacterium saguini]
MINHRCAVLGKPIAHSLSPVLHNAAYKALRLSDWFYDKHEIGEGDLDAFLKSLDSSWAGLSLTMPLKKTIQPYGTPTNLWARELKVANTAVFDWSHVADDPAWPHGKPSIKLYNTDVIGIQLAFDHAHRELGLYHQPDRTGNALIIGNGNTATSALAALSMMPEIGHVTIAARHPGKNTALQPLAERYIATAAPYSEINLADKEALLAVAQESTYVINTIPGHAADGIASELNEVQTIALHGLLLDVVYDPRPTQLMTAWRLRGGNAIGGEEMLLYQALVQVLLMTGIWDNDPPSDADKRLQDTTTEDDQLEIAMRNALEEAL